MDTCWWITSPAHHPIINSCRPILECYAYHFGVNSTEPTRVETKPVGKHRTTIKTTSSRKKPVQTVTWSDVPNDVWQKYTLGAPEVRKIPEGYVIIEMYNTSRSENHQKKEKEGITSTKMYVFLEQNIVAKMFLCLHKLTRRLTFGIIYFL